MVGLVTRIIGGSAGGRTLRTPAGSSTRPTSDRVREALFSALESRLGTLRGRTFLDVYAGSGAVGLEAASRGAAFVTLVERDRAAAALIGANAHALGLPDVAVVTGAAESLARTAAPPPPRAPVQVAFLDPPYDVDSATVAGVVEGLSAAGWLAAAAVVVVERSRRSDALPWPVGLRAARERRYGDTVLWYATWEPGEET